MRHVVQNAAAAPPADKRRRMPRAACAGLAVALTAAAPALAAVDTFTASVETRFFGSNSANGVGDRVNRTATQNSAPGVPITFFEQSFAGGFADAKSTGQASGRASAGHVGARVNGEITAAVFNSQTDLSISATATVNDVLTILASPVFELGRKIHVENMLTLDGFDEHALRVWGGFSNGHFLDFVTGAVNTGVAVSGTGIDPGPGNVNVVGSTFESFDFSRGFVSSVVNPPETIKFALDFIVGIPVVTTLSIAVNGFGITSNLDNLTHKDGFARWTADYGHTLAWGGTTTFTDALTGEVLSGVEIASASGFDYAHPGGAVGGVPEPATWALMIGGFGMAGVALRRRRGAFA